MHRIKSMTDNIQIRSKFFKVAQSGATVDGREITPEQIKQMAANYSPDTYGARVWLEHFRGLYADSAFKALGDVLAVESREENGVTGLYAQIAPSADLIRMNRERQKIFTSIEMDPKFSDTGEAYLSGLAVTDSPASLGTEALHFCTNRKQKADNEFSPGTETAMEFEEFSEKSEGPTLLDKVRGMFSKHQDNTGEQFADVSAAVEEIAQHQVDMAEQFSELKTSQPDLQPLEQRLAEMETKYSELLTQLDNTPDKNHSQRPPATGGDGKVKTDC